LVSSLLFVKYTLSLRKFFLTYNFLQSGKRSATPIMYGAIPGIQEFRLILGSGIGHDNL
jgi:hypothetical protein